MPEIKHVKTEECKQRQKLVWQVLSALGLAIAVGVVLPVWAVSAAYHVEKDVDEVRHALHTHIEVQNTHERHLHTTLDELRISQGKIFDTVQEILKKD